MLNRYHLFGFFAALRSAHSATHKTNNPVHELLGGKISSEA